MNFEIGNRVKIMTKKEIMNGNQIETVPVLFKGEIVAIKKTVIALVGYFEGDSKVGLISFPMARLKIAATRIMDKELSLKINETIASLKGKRKPTKPNVKPPVNTNETATNEKETKGEKVNEDMKNRLTSIAKEPVFRFKGTTRPNHVSIGKYNYDPGKDSIKNMETLMTYYRRVCSDATLDVITNNMDLLNKIGKTGYKQPDDVYSTQFEPVEHSEVVKIIGVKTETSRYVVSTKVTGDRTWSAYVDLNSDLTRTKHGNCYSFTRNRRHDFVIINLAIFKGQVELVNLMMDFYKIDRETAITKVVDSTKYKYYQETQEVLKAVVDRMSDDENYEFMIKYENENQQSYATAYMTKKNINPKIADAMANSKFLQQGFSYVEYDNDVEIVKAEQISNEWAKVYPMLPKCKELPVLRFRKLGKHNALGIFFPAFNCIGVDLRTVQSFMHEYGHYIDYNLNETNLSLTPEFKNIVASYKTTLRSDYMGSFVGKKEWYYCTPTEVFARGFEIYLSSKVKTSLLKEPEVYKTREDYLCFKHCMPELMDYMTSVFG